MPIRAVGEHHARDERAERSGEAQRLHDRRRCDDGEECCKHEHLALAEIADDPEQRAQQETPGQDQSANRGNGIEEQQPTRRAAGIGRIARQHRDQRDQRHDRQILEQQDRKSAFAERRAHAPGRLQHREHLRGGGERQRQAEHQRRRCREMHRGDQSGDRQPAQQNLQQAEPEDFLSQRPQSTGVEFEADDEQQQRDAEFGHADHRFGIADQMQHVRPDHRPRDEIPQRRAEAEAAEDQDEDERETAKDDTVAEQRFAHTGAFAVAAACAASAAASNASRIEACRALCGKAGVNNAKPGQSGSGPSPPSQAAS